MHITPIRLTPSLLSAGDRSSPGRGLDRKLESEQCWIGIESCAKTLIQNCHSVLGSHTLTKGTAKRIPNVVYGT